jgi:hypothetical protein
MDWTLNCQAAKTAVLPLEKPPEQIPHSNAHSSYDRGDKDHGSDQK